MTKPAISSIDEVTAEQFDAVVTQSALPVLVFYWTPECSACTQFFPELEGIAQMYAGRMKLVTFNTWLNQGFAQGQGVAGHPTSIIYRGALAAGSYVGAPAKLAYYTPFIDTVLA
jgi:thioredoxin-like negative regulator of GroEL